jgi:hypothetical protein
MFWTRIRNNHTGTLIRHHVLSHILRRITYLLYLVIFTVVVHSSVYDDFNGYQCFLPSGMVSEFFGGLGALACKSPVEA